jgi:hypothetical protein
VNAGLLYSDVYEGRLKRPIENKENFLNVECPLIIQAAIGGDLDIFKFLVDRGANLQTSGHICLSRKNKNSVISNVLGAASFYGRVNLVHFILEKYSKVDVNFKASEKKGKAKQFSLNKEFTDFTPAHLAISSEISDDDSILEILKLLRNYRAELTLQDINKNNILHLASKYENMRVVQFIVEDLKLSHLVNEINKEGQSPVSITADREIVDYLKSCTNSNENKIEDELNDLIESVNKEKQKKKNKKKKGVEKDDVLLGSTGYQETFQLPKPKPVVVKETVQSVPENKRDSSSTSQTKKEESFYQEENSFDKNKSTKIYDSSTNKSQYYDKNNYYTEKRDYKDYKDRNYNYNSNQGYDRGYNKRDYNYNNYGNYYSEDGNYYKSEKNSYKKNYVKPKEEVVDTNVNINERKDTLEVIPQEKSIQVTSVQNTGNAIDIKPVKPTTGIIGLNVKSKKNKKEAKKDQQQLASAITVEETQTENKPEEENKKIDLPKEEVRIESPLEEPKHQTVVSEKLDSNANVAVHEDYEIDEDFIGDDEILRATVPRDIVDEKESTPSQNENNNSQEVEKEISQSKSRKESDFKESQNESHEVKSNLENKEIIPQHKPTHIPISQDSNTREITVIKLNYIKLKFFR